MLVDKLQRAILKFQADVETELDVKIGDIKLEPWTKVHSHIKSEVGGSVPAWFTIYLNGRCGLTDLFMTEHMASYYDGEPYVFHSINPLAHVLPHNLVDWTAVHEMAHLGNEAILNSEKFRDVRHGSKIPERLANYIADKIIGEKIGLSVFTRLATCTDDRSYNLFNGKTPAALNVFLSSEQNYRR
ncbi:hypothetical protein K8R30_01110 [archaeon]|nr:hypothetical protein [archaeon]